ncbi:MAG: hypothetical protein U0W24_01825 [Bacteroidales bacterium]
MKSKISLLIILPIMAVSCGDQNRKLTNSERQKDSVQTPKRFFSDDSFWNQPIAENPEVDPRSDKWIGMLKTDRSKANFIININEWTIPVYEADSTTPRYNVQFHYLTPDEKKTWATKREHFGHGPGYGENVPIPDYARPDKESDAHFAVIDWTTKTAWDMWGLRKRPDGTWESNTGMKYRIDGSGVYDSAVIKPVNGESVHFHGPSRAAGVPAIAGLIMYDEVMAGEIKHKLACATRFNAFQEFTYPAIWTDGFVESGIPEGAVIQLDPNLDLSKFDLLPAERIVAKALQKYGAVVVDIAQGTPLYAEGLWAQKGKTWEGKLRKMKGINYIPLEHYRVLKVGPVTKKGDGRWKTYDKIDF